MKNTKPRHVNVKDDFILRERFHDRDGNIIPLPDIDFSLTYTTKHNSHFVASRENGIYNNCTPVGDYLFVIFKNHALCEGMLKRELHLSLPNNIMPDGKQNVFISGELNLQLWHLSSDGFDDVIDADLLLPLLQIPAPAPEHPKPLPFVFLKPEMVFYPGVAYFDRRRKLFLRDNEVISPDENTYNELDADGRIRASTSREFISSNVLYRYTGREVSNLAIERNPNQRFVHHIPTLDAQPGLAFAWCDAIAVRLDRFIDGGRVSLKGMYLRDLPGKLIPLKDLNIHQGPDSFRVARIDGDELVYDGFDKGRVLLTRGSQNLMSLPSSSGRASANTTHVGVRYDAEGNKIFYLFEANVHARKATPPTPQQVMDLLETRVENTGVSTSPYECCSICVAHYKPNEWQMYIWRRRRHGYGLIIENDDGKMRHRYYRNVYKWRKLLPSNPHAPEYNSRTCLIKARRRKKRASWSDWTYFHLDLRTGKARYSRRQRWA